MPRVRRKGRRRTDYTENERHALLSGLVMNPWSTRFIGLHPRDFRPRNDQAIKDAWDALSDELLVEWQGDRYAKDRERHGKPWAVRFLEDKQCHE